MNGVIHGAQEHRWKCDYVVSDFLLMSLGLESNAGRVSRQSAAMTNRLAQVAAAIGDPMASKSQSAPCVIAVTGRSSLSVSGWPAGHGKYQRTPGESPARLIHSRSRFQKSVSQRWLLVLDARRWTRQGRCCGISRGGEDFFDHRQDARP